MVYANSDFVDTQGNAHRQTGDGTQAAAEDVWFAMDRTYSLANIWADVLADIAAFPDLPGYGTVRDLHQVMSLDTNGDLKALVAAYSAEPDEGQRHFLLDAIVYAWTGVVGINPASRGSYVDARQQAALEKLLGDGFYQPGWGANPGSTAGGAGNDFVDGGVGDDLLDGNAGSDVYLFQPGFGQDYIHQYD